MAEQTIINIDAGIPGDDDINADWIKRVNGGRSQIQELAIHKRLAKKYAAERAKGGGGKQSSLLAAMTGEAALDDAPEADDDAPDMEEDAAPLEDDTEDAAPLEDDEDTDAAPVAKPKGDAPFTKPAPKADAKPAFGAKPAKPEDEEEVEVDKEEEDV